MKQTNNAIKFLMAQYRAIFKNANIAMVAAMAAAALSAGQAQAADTAYWEALTGEATALNTTKEQVGDNEKKASGSFTLSIVENGKLVLGGDTAVGKFLPADKGTATISIDGGALEVGKGKAKGAELTLTALNVNNGSAHVGGATAEASLVKAGAITIGTAPAAEPPAGDSPKAAASATFTIGKNGSITSTGGLNIYNNGELQFLTTSTADSKVTTTDGISLLGGKISVVDSGAGTIDSAITSTGGTISVGTDGTNATALTVNGNVAFNGEGGAVTIANKGKLTVTHKTEDVLLNLGNATVTNGGTIDFGTLASKKSSHLNSFRRPV